jgi:hypothetical protein
MFVESAGKTGNQMNPTVAFAVRDVMHVDGVPEPVAPVYPAAVYSHQEGDSIGNGFVYRGKLMPPLPGKYIFNDLTTGRIFYVDFIRMMATHGEHNRWAQIHELQTVCGTMPSTSRARR